uniref:Uncharacterized protein n=1 Tax=Cyprinodon variegatus TaxID=28743 RepID=A0A3Q2CPH8_CYPVA
MVGYDLRLTLFPAFLSPQEMKSSSSASSFSGPVQLFVLSDCSNIIARQHSIETDIEEPNELI